MSNLRKTAGALIAALAVAGILAAGGASAFADSNLLSNGSFENPTVSGDYSTIFSGGAIGAWDVTSGSVDLINTYWNAEDGNQSLDMSGNGPGSIAQTVNTTNGQEYQLSFWMAGNTDGGNQTKSLSAIIDGNQIGDALFNDAGKSRSNMGWQEYTYDFVSTGGPTTVTFQSNENNPYGAALDNVSLKAVPEASTVLLFSLLLVGGVLALRRKQTA